MVELLNKASYAYYTENREIISDWEYDRLYDELLELEEKTGILLSNSPTRQVGHEVLQSLEKVEHDIPMLSLDKTKDINRLKAFLDHRMGLLTPKLDGLTLVLHYAEGKLIRAVTRGNGTIGENVTHNVNVFKNVPVKTEYQGSLVIRGEAVISFPEFKKINEKEGQVYKNPRNLCSGTVRQLDSKAVSDRNVNFFAFSLVHSDKTDFDNSKCNQINWLKDLGFQVVETKIVTADTVEKAVQELTDAAVHSDFASDGLVLTLDDIAYSDSLGRTSKFPKDSIAFKWADEIAETKLENIDWSVSRTGLINPIAIFKPVELEGTTVSKASLHNLGILENLELGIGDTITVYKANMIIPQVAQNLTRSGTATLPEHCPVCGEETEIIQQAEGKSLCCPNPNCKAQTVQSISHFCSRDAMNIQGLSEMTIEKFVDGNYLENYTSLWKLQEFESEITALKGFGQKSYDKLIKAIESAKDVKLPNFIYSLGIKHVGLSNAKRLCEHYNYSPQKIAEAEYEELLTIEGFGEVIASSLVKYFSKPENRQLFDYALGQLRLITVESSANLLLAGKTFVITGDLEAFGNRKELQELIEKYGGKVTGGVTSKTDFLINNNIYSTSGKNKKANELNVPIINEKDFLNMVNAE